MNGKCIRTSVMRKSISEQPAEFRLLTTRLAMNESPDTTEKESLNYSIRRDIIKEIRLKLYSPL